MTNRLYIIGNGFDLFHGIKSRYSDFKEFLETEDHSLLILLETYFNKPFLWSDFEESLKNIDVIKLVAHHKDHSYSIDGEQQYDIYDLGQTERHLTSGLKKMFTKWICSLEPSKEKIINLSIHSKYLTFNYTNTLESIYSISDKNITYLHNKAVDNNSTLIIGHGRQKREEKKFSLLDFFFTDYGTKIEEDTIDNYYSKTYKNTNKVIRDHTFFFENIENIDEVFVLGHSMRDVDLKYFRTIINQISSKAVWTVTFYTEADLVNHELKLRELGVDNSSFNLVPFTQL